MDAIERAHWKVHYKVEKFHGERVEGDPYEIIEGEGNILVNAGIRNLLDLLIGAGTPTVFNNANAHLGVGDSTAAAGAGQTDLQGTNKTRSPMETSYPSRTDQTATFRAIFGTTDANQAWEEWAIFGAAVGGVMLNRKVQSFGTKSTGTWAFTVSVTVS